MTLNGRKIETPIFMPSSHNVIHGFLNLNFTSEYLINTLKNINPNKECKPNNELKIIEFCSPNTNKPLHLGHIRNILLGDSKDSTTIFGPRRSRKGSSNNICSFFTD